MRSFAARLWLGTGLVLGAVVALGNPIAFLACVAYGAVGCFLVVRRPRNLIGWLLILIAAGSSIVAPSLGTWSADLAQGTAPGWVPFVLLLQRLCSVAGISAAVALLATVFPSGRWPSGGVARMSTLGFALIGLLALLQLFAPMLRVEDGASRTGLIQVANPIGIAPGWPGWELLEPGGAADLLGVIGLVLCVVGFIVRFRQSAGTERLQDKWLVGSLAFLIGALTWGSVLVIAAGPDAASRMDSTTYLLASVVAWGPMTLALPLPPIAVGIAILRYRLYEIDRIISRTLGWALVTGLLGAVFAGLVVGLQALFATFTGGSTLAIAASTLVVAALFQPLRRRIQRTVDRRFNRARYDATRTAEAFTEQLRNEVDVARLRIALVDTVETAVRPVSTTVWLRVGSR